MPTIHSRNESEWKNLTQHVDELEKNQEELHEALLAKDSFLSICGHELKTPLTSLSLQTQMAQRALKQGDSTYLTPEKIEKLIQLTDKQVKKLLRLVEDLIDHSKIQVGKFTITPETFDLCDLVKEVVERYGPQTFLANCHLDLKITESVIGFWDRLRIDQVITNLIDNALKFGNGNPVQIAVGAKDGQAWITVLDHGSGIPAEHQTRVFQQYEQLSNDIPKCGMGLGLFISKNIIELHGGSIELASTPGIGSVFTVKLPLSAPGVLC